MQAEGNPPFFARKSQPPPPADSPPAVVGEPSSSSSSTSQTFFPPLPPIQPPPPPPPPPQNDTSNPSSGERPKHSTVFQDFDVDFSLPFSQYDIPNADNQAMEQDEIEKENCGAAANQAATADKRSGQETADKNHDQLDQLLDELESQNAAPGSSTPHDTGTAKSGRQTKRAAKKTGPAKPKADGKKSGKKEYKIPKLPKFPLPPQDVLGRPPLLGDTTSPHSPQQTSSFVPGSSSPPSSSSLSFPCHFPSMHETTSSENEQTVRASSSSSTTSSAYQKKPNKSKGSASLCLDLSSNRFTPEDEKRVIIVLRKMHGDPQDIPDLSMSTAEKENTKIHDFPAVISSDVTGIPLHRAAGSSVKMNHKQYLVITDFCHPPSAFQTVVRRDLLPFLLVVRPTSAPAGHRWEVPSQELARDFTNEVLNELFMSDNPAADAYEKTGKWGLFTVIYLSSLDQERMDNFRRAAASKIYLDNTFDMYPKDALQARTDISILLRSSMKTWNVEITPKVLFKRNTSLAGSLRVLSTFFFAASDFSNKGESKVDWRKINLAGDDQFLRCLQNHPESHPFLLGVDAVQIRGGLRPQESPTATLGKRVWSPAPQSAIAAATALTTTATTAAVHPNNYNSAEQQVQAQPHPPLFLFDPAAQQPQGGSASSQNRGSTAKRGRASNRRGRGRGRNLRK